MEAVTSQTGYAKMPTGPTRRLRRIYDPGRAELRVIADVLALRQAHRRDRCERRTERASQMFIDANSLRSATIPRHVTFALCGLLACSTSYPRSNPPM
jgi:hypothetical protein